MSVSVMTQVHLSHSVYLDSLQSFTLAQSIESINTRLLKAAQNEQRQGKLHQADVLKYEIELLESQIDALKQYGELQNSLEQLNNSMGLPLHFVNDRTYGEITEPVEEVVKKENTPPKDLGDEADELRDIYLDYIIEKIEKEEMEIQHQRAEALDEERKSHEEDHHPTQNPTDEEAPINTKNKQTTSALEGIMQKYQVTPNESQGSQEVDVSELLKKYGSSKDKSN